MTGTCRVFYGNIWNGASKYGDIVAYIGVLSKKKLKQSGLQCFLLIERLKTGVLMKNKLK